MLEDQDARAELAALSRTMTEQFAEVQHTLRLYALAVAGLDQKIETLGERDGTLEATVTELREELQAGHAAILKALA